MQGAIYLYFGGTLAPRHAMLTKGSFDDMEKLGVEPKEGSRFTFYDFDADDQNRPVFLCAEGVLHFDREAERWTVAVDEETFRVVPQTHT